jgi:hypothetical protein
MIILLAKWVYTLVYLYNILGGCPFHPSKFLILKEEDDGRGEGRMAASAVYPNVYVYPVYIYIVLF